MTTSETESSLAATESIKVQGSRGAVLFASWFGCASAAERATVGLESNDVLATATNETLIARLNVFMLPKENRVPGLENLELGDIR